MGALAALTAAVLLAAGPRPAAPSVIGPRDTTLERPVYTFRARGAVGFRCAFDATALHRCARRYSERLLPGAHTLRVRSVGRGGAVSRVVAVRVRVRFPVPELVLGSPVAVGAGAGVPAPHANGVWVPITADGSLVRVANRSIASRTAVGFPPGGPGDLDSAVADDRRVTERAIWTASDAGARIARVDPSTGAVTARVEVAPRPGGLTATERNVWAFHFIQGIVTRLDVATAAATQFQVPEARGTGIAWADGSLWLLSAAPSRVYELDPATGAVRREFRLSPPFAARRAVVETWSLAVAGRAVWAALPNHAGRARVDADAGTVSYVPVRYGNPFGVAVGGGSLWVATDRAVLQMDPGSGELRGAVLIPPASRTGFVSIAYGYGAAWLTNYDRGTLTQVTPPAISQ